MTRALILSDIHGEENNLRWLLEEVWKTVGPIDAYICLGDGVRDFERAESFIRNRDEHATMYAVRGNCDFISSCPERLMIHLGGLKSMGLPYLRIGGLLRPRLKNQKYRDPSFHPMDRRNQK